MTEIEFAKRCMRDYKSYTCDKCSYAVKVEETKSVSFGFNGEKEETNIICTGIFTIEDKFFVPLKFTCGAWKKK